MIHFSRQFFLRLLLVLAFANLAAVSAGLILGWRRAAVENGFVENTQLALIFVSLMSAALASAWSARLLRVVMAGWAATSLLMIQREIDFRTFGEDHWLFTLHDTTLRLAFWLPVAAILLAWGLRYRRQALRSILAVSWNHAWLPVMIGVIMLCSELTEQALKAGWIADYAVAVFFEELFELNAYCIIAGAAVTIAMRARRPGSFQEVDARNNLEPTG